MKSTLQTKLLQHLAKKKNQNGGFTLIELLVVVIIIGVLAAVALPSFLSQADKAKQSSAQSALDAVNKAQQVYYMEKSAFTNSYANLGGTPKVEGYTFAAPSGGTTTTTAVATPSGNLKQYTGTVTVDTATGTSTALVEQK